MADNKAKWQEATQQILAKLDIAAEYRALGLDVTGHKPNARGWLEARSYGIEDRTPSAGINVAEGPMLGRYKDFRAETSGLFNFAAKVGRFADWRAARNHYAHQTGVALPSGEDEFVADRFVLSALTVGLANNYRNAKPGVSFQAIFDCGGQQARWPKALSAEKTNHLIAFPMYGASLLDQEPVGWHCVSQNPKYPIRQYQGQGNPDKLLDKMTAGEYGLMNVDGLRRLEEAEVVNIVEGISDLLAGQAVLADWRAGDPENRKHVVLSAGACTYHPKVEWMQHFAGKEVRLWFDVGDAKDEGQVAAAVWVKALLPVASIVRNCTLPLGPEGGKNDLRAWLVGEPAAGKAAHNYADMNEYASSFVPIEATDETAQLSTGDAILANIGITVIGEHDGRTAIEVYSDARRKSGTIFDIDKLSIAKLVQLVGADIVDKYIHDGRECPPDKYDIKKVRHAIAHAASDKQFYGDEKYGAGIWEHDGQLVLVKAKEVGILNGSGRIEQSNLPFVNGRILDCGRNSGDWYDLGTLNRYLAEAVSHEWCDGVISEAVKMFSMWTWRQAQQTPTVITGLVIASWLQSIWPWRPQVFVTGNSNTGKTILLQEVVAEGIFGKLGMFVEKPTEAAISQRMRHHSKVIFVDEFEKDTHRQKILELFRTTSRGGVKIRGTADHRGAEFRLKHIPWLSAVESGLTREADKNRYIILDLDTITDEKRAKFLKPPQSQCIDLGLRLLAIGLAHYQEAKRLTRILQVMTLPNVPSRCVESFALPVAVIAAGYGWNEQQATELLKAVMGGWDFTFQQSQDHVECLSTILTQKARLPRGEEKIVSALLREMPNPDNINALNGVGVRIIQKRNSTDQVLWLCHDVVNRTLLRNTKFTDHSIDQYLMRFRGACHSRQRLGGDERFNGVEVPMQEVRTLFESNSEEDSEDTSII